MKAVRLRGVLAVVGWGVLSALLAVGVTGRAGAQLPRYATDPVEALRQALRIKILDPEGNPDELRFRKQNLERRIAALHNVSQVRRALALEGWQDNALDPKVRDVDLRARERLAARLARDLRAYARNDDANVRLGAAGMLYEMGMGFRGAAAQSVFAQELTPELLKLTADPVPAVRQEAARALGNIYPEPKTAVPALEKLAGEDSVATRRAAATGLNEMAQNLVLLLPSKSQGGRNFTNLNPSDADKSGMAAAVVRAVGRELADGDYEVRRLALEAVRACAIVYTELTTNVEAVDLPPPGRKLSDVERQIVDKARAQIQGIRKTTDSLARALSDQVPAMSRLLRESDPRLRELSAKALEELGNAHRAIRRQDQSVPRYETASSGTAEEQEPRGDDPFLPALRAALPVLEAALQDPDCRVRVGAIDVLEMLGESAGPAVPAIVAALRDPVLFVRMAGARTLGRIGTVHIDVSVPALAQLLWDPDFDVKVTAALTLEIYGAPAVAAAPALARAVTCGDAEFRVAVMHALESIGVAAAPAAVPALIEALGNEDYRVRQTAADTLGSFGPAARAAEDALRKAVNDENEDVRRAASDALLSLVPEPAEPGS